LPTFFRLWRQAFHQGVFKVQSVPNHIRVVLRCLKQRRLLQCKIGHPDQCKIKIPAANQGSKHSSLRQCLKFRDSRNCAHTHTHTHKPQTHTHTHVCSRAHTHTHMYKQTCASSNAIGIPQKVMAVVYCGRDFEVQSTSCIASPYATQKVAKVKQTLHNARGRGHCIHVCVRVFWRSQRLDNGRRRSTRLVEFDF